MNKNNIKNLLKSIIVFNKNIIDLELVKNIRIIDSNNILIYLLLSDPKMQVMHFRRKISHEIIDCIHKNINHNINVTLDFKVSLHDKETKIIDKNKFFHIKNIITIISGKGGVGKSTISSNIAVGLYKSGFKVGLMDADINGPSIPIMFDLSTEKVSYLYVNGVKKIKPIVSYGVKILSIGFFIDIQQPIVWRGPMISKAIKELLFNSHWGNLDFLIIDLPPGTSDTHISIFKMIQVSGAIIVSTPQNISLSDVVRSIVMLQKSSLRVPIIGVVENMSFFSPQNSCNKYYIFGKDGGKKLSLDFNVPFLGQIPIYESIRESGDCGRPAVLQTNSCVADYFMKIVDNIINNNIINV